MLKERVSIARRFLRSVRIDSDLGESHALDGFVCPHSSAEVLATMARHVSETGQGAFTWTGPYGSGKSSLVVALGALLNGNESSRSIASGIFGEDLSSSLWNAFPTRAKGWRVLPVVGRRDKPVDVIGGEARKSGIIARSPRGGWNESNLVAELLKAATADSDHGGLILFIDEMGKFLEAAAQDGSDLYVFQELAEAASRSKGRLLVIGVLHQAFEEYAHRLSNEMRDEWAKIQGRYIDLLVDTAGEEQIDLVGRAIESEHNWSKPSDAAVTVSQIVRRDRPADAERLATMLERCWPLHPAVACLLGPISKRRFGQNQRSIFGFLNSSEPHGFQDFLELAALGDLYTPDQLWDYLRSNLEPSILASPDGHRWALAAEALERCESYGADDLRIKLLKSIAVIDLFKERSGLVASFDLLSSCIPSEEAASIEKALKELNRQSFTIFKKFLNAHAIFAGSDFDIDRALRNALDQIQEIDFKQLKTLAGLQPLLAKRHYHETGTMRWFEVDILPVEDVVDHAAKFAPKNGAMGKFILAIPTGGEGEEAAEKQCQLAARQSSDWDVVVGISNQSWAIVPLARDLFALDIVSRNHPELAGDDVARREVFARIAELQSMLEVELQKAFDSASWYRKFHSKVHFGQADLNSLASELAHKRFDQSPVLLNELLNRQKPSANAIAAQNNLLRRMVLHEGEARLGIEGFPAEGGLFASVLESTGLYAKIDGELVFSAPKESGTDPCNLQPLWDDAATFVSDNSDRTIAVSEIYDLWRQSPFGVKDGLLPVLSVAFILSQRRKLALYRNGIFRSAFDDVDVEYLAKDASSIQIRWMDINEVSRKLLSAMAEIVRDLDRCNELTNLEPIDVAKGLVAIYDRLPKWTTRTMRLSDNAIRIRDLFKKAKDPNKFLFDDIPEVFGDEFSEGSSGRLEHVIESVREGLEELVNAYPAMLHRLRDLMLTELQVPNDSPQSIAELRARAENAAQVAGEFRLESFVGRISRFDGTDESFEDIASLAANRPPRDWVDPLLDQSSIELAELAQRFIRVETFTRVKGRPQKRLSLAVVIGMDGRPVPLLEEFDVTDSDKGEVKRIIKEVESTIDSMEASKRSVVLAALAELSAKYMNSGSQEKEAEANEEVA